MELEELKAELDNLRSGIEADRFNAAKNDWYNNFGSDLISGGYEDIGNVMFQNLFQNGDYSAAATYAMAQELQKDLDKVSAAVTALVKKLPDTLEKIKDRQDKLMAAAAAGDSSNQTDKAADDTAKAMEELDQVASEIDEENAGPAPGGEMLPPDAGMMPPDIGAGSPPPPDAGMMPSEAGGDVPQPDASMMPPEAGAGAPPPPDAGGEMPSPDVPPQTNTSDIRAKNIKKKSIGTDRIQKIVSDFNQKRIQKNGFKVPSHILGAVRGGW